MFLGHGFCFIISDANHYEVLSSFFHSFGFAFCSASLTVPHSHTVRKEGEVVKYGFHVVLIKIEVPGVSGG